LLGIAGTLIVKALGGISLGRKEESELMREAGPGYLKSMILIFLNTGLRRQELLKLTWENVDFKKRRLFIR